jgi:hypothetical protein
VKPETLRKMISLPARPRGVDNIKMFHTKDKGMNSSGSKQVCVGLL